MNQKQIEVAIRAALVDMLAEQEITLPVVAAFPSSKEGRVDDGIYFHLISRGKNGWQFRKYEEAEDALINHESQINEYMFQFNAYVKDNEKADEQLLAEDVLAITRGILQSIKYVGLMQSQGIGVQRATDIVTPTFINEYDNFEHNPNFTIIFTHTRTLSITTPKLDSFDITIEEKDHVN